MESNVNWNTLRWHWIFFWCCWSFFYAARTQTLKRTTSSKRWNHLTLHQRETHFCRLLSLSNRVFSGTFMPAILKLDLALEFGYFRLFRILDSPNTAVLHALLFLSYFNQSCNTIATRVFASRVYNFCFFLSSQQPKFNFFPTSQWNCNGVANSLATDAKKHLLLVNFSDLDRNATQKVSLERMSLYVNWIEGISWQRVLQNHDFSSNLGSKSFWVPLVVEIILME